MSNLLKLAVVLVAGTTLAAPPARKAGKPPSDAEIAAIVVAANQVDIEAGELARSKTTNEQVTQFAQLMILDHTAVNESATELVTKLDVTPQENETSRKLKKDGEANLKKLKPLTGAAFDKAYVDQEVTYHVAVLKLIDDVLVPNAKNEDLKALIVKVRPTIAAHLEHAQMLKRKLAAGAAL